MGTTDYSATRKLWVAKNKERIREYNREHRKNNIEKYRERDRARYEQRIEYNKDWRGNNKDRVIAYAKQQLNKRRRAKTTYELSEYDKEIHIQQEVMRSVLAKYGEYHIDHIIPLSKGGSDKADNRIIMTAELNLVKGNKVLEDFWINILKGMIL